MTTETRFAPGTFTPHPQPAPRGRMLAAQTRMELFLLLRNGEQLLLTMFIPITLLIGLTLLPLGSSLGSHHRVDRIVPAVMMVAIMSTAFTGQAIAVGFDRRYGALKRLGATALPRWGIVGGKCAAVLIVVVLQSLMLGAIGLALGWRPSPAGLLAGAVVIALGTATFAAMGLLLGGTLKAEVVLALANILWFAMLGASSLVFTSDNLPRWVALLARLVPSGALAEALDRAQHCGVDWYGLIVLLAWGLVAGYLAVRWFRFD